MTTYHPPAHGVEATVCRDIAKRQRLGMNKYGVSVANNPLDIRAWLNHAYEECLDQAVYLRRAIEEIDNTEPKLSKDEINGMIQSVIEDVRNTGLCQEKKPKS